MVQKILLILVLLFPVMTVRSVDRYVATGGTNDAGGGYTNWAGAATNVEWAVNAALTNDIIWISNGVFNLTNNLNLGSAITLRGVNGRDNMTINGGYNGSTGWHINASQASTVDGITISNGYGRAVWGDAGGFCGAFLDPVHLYNSRVTYCYGTAPIVMNYGGVVSNCIISHNVNLNSAGGVTLQGSVSILNCLIYSNSGYYSGGIYISFGNTLTLVSGCIISNNSSGNWSGGGGLFIASGGGGTVKNCIIVGNYLRNGYSYPGGGVYVSNKGKIVNCTIAFNYATNCGGIYIKTNMADSIVNCIIYSNFTTSAFTTSLDTVFYDSLYTNAFLNCCLTNGDLPAGQNCITSNPQFVNWSGNNYRLLPNSPCINTGTNQSWMTNAVDLDGRMRIRYGTVDIGAYEKIYEGTIFTVP